MYHLIQRSRSAVLLLSLGIALFILIPAQRREPEDSVPPAQYAGDSISAGSIAYLSDGGRLIAVGADRPTFTALAQAVEAKDRKAYEHLFRNGHAFLVDDRVRVRVVSFQVDTAQVEFLEGPHSAKSGFVLREWLRSKR